MNSYIVNVGDTIRFDGQLATVTEFEYDGNVKWVYEDHAGPVHTCVVWELWARLVDSKRIEAAGFPGLRNATDEQLEAVWLMAREWAKQSKWCSCCEITIYDDNEGSDHGEDCPLWDSGDSKGMGE